MLTEETLRKSKENDPCAQVPLLNMKTLSLQQISQQLMEKETKSWETQSHT